MPLSTATRRQLIHTRTVTCNAFKRDDGLWDIEGHMTDIKTLPIPNEDRGGSIPPGEPLHEMWLRLTLDTQLTIHNAEASTEHAPFLICPNITGAYKALKGLNIGPGWTKKVRALLGKAGGCTHHTELLGPMATTAFQALYEELKKQEQQNNQPPAIINTCHALAQNSPVTQRLWPEYYQTDNGQPELNKETSV